MSSGTAIVRDGKRMRHNGQESLRKTYLYASTVSQGADLSVAPNMGRRATLAALKRLARVSPAMQRGRLEKAGGNEREALLGGHEDLLDSSSRRYIRGEGPVLSGVAGIPMGFWEIGRRRFGPTGFPGWGCPPISGRHVARPLTRCHGAPDAHPRAHGLAVTPDLDGHSRSEDWEARGFDASQRGAFLWKLPTAASTPPNRSDPTSFGRNREKILQKIASHL